MEELGGGGGADRSRHHRSAPSSDRLLGVFSHQPATSALALELSEQDIFNTPSGSSPSSPTHSASSPNPTRSVGNHSRNHYGILAALNDNLKTRSGSDSRPVFNHKASAPVSLSSSASTSPAASASSRMAIPRKPPPPPPPVERMRPRHQSAPVNVPVMPAALRRRARDLEDVLSEDEEEEEEANGVILPPHEVVAARDSPLLANSVLEGAGRTLKGRDLRQVRNAIWRKTGFLD